jgi:hypothetical protein
VIRLAWCELRVGLVLNVGGVGVALIYNKSRFFFLSLFFRLILYC